MNRTSLGIVARSGQDSRTKSDSADHSPPAVVLQVCTSPGRVFVARFLIAPGTAVLTTLATF